MLVRTRTEINRYLLLRLVLICRIVKRNLLMLPPLHVSILLGISTLEKSYLSHP